MDYTCPICNTSIPRDILKFRHHMEEHMVDVIKEQHPDWVEEDGFCPRCYDYLKQQMPNRRED